MQNLEEQFSDLRIHVDKKLATVRQDQSEIMETMKNVEALREGLHTPVQENAASIHKLMDNFGNISGRVDDCIDGILDIKGIIADMHMSSGNSSSEHARKM